MSTPSLRLTKPQRDVLEILLSEEMGKEFTTGYLGKTLLLGPSYLRNYFCPRLMGLAKRGFLIRRLENNRAYWKLGPMIDVLIEKELIVNGKIII
jgi:hypothetical protein